MEANKISCEAKALTLENGLELTYCELGEENEEVIISGAFYFHTFTPVLEELAKKYHVYGVVMRIDSGEHVTMKNEDGSINWSRQWGDDIYQFAKKLGIESFHYVGKCHGTNPGWYLVKEHPECLKTFSSFYMAPHLMKRSSNLWTEVPQKEGQIGLLSKAMRNQDLIPVKIAEAKTLGENTAGGPEAGDQMAEIGLYAENPQMIWESLESCERDLKKTEIPILLMFGTDDLVFIDHKDSNIKAMETINRAKTIILQGERHLMEMDCPDRMASEAIFFMEEAKKEYK